MMNSQTDDNSAESFWRRMHGAPGTRPIQPGRQPLDYAPSPSWALERADRGPAAVATLHRFSQARALAPRIVAEAAWACLLARYTGETRVAFGAVLADDPPAAAYPILVETTLEEPAEACLQRIHALAAEHQRIGRATLADVRRWRGLAAGAKIFETVVIVAESAGASVAESLATGAELVMMVALDADSSALSLHYDASRFDRDAVRRMVRHYCNLLEAIVTAPGELIGRLPMLSADEIETVTRRWNDTRVPYVLDVCLHELFERQVDRAPEVTALIFGDERLTYRELDTKSNQLAWFLMRAGVGPERLVGVAMERSIEMVVSLMAVLKAGGAYVPLDPTYPRQRLRAMMEDASVPVLLTQDHLASLLPEHEALTVRVDAQWDEIAAENATRPSAGAGPDNLSYVIFTSGSTGRPKGAMNTHRAICNRLLWMQDTYGLTADDRVLQKTPFSFDVSVWEFFWPLMTGARLVVAKPEGHKDGAYLVKLIRAEGITTLHFVPSMLQAFLEERDVESCNDHLKRVICSGEALPFALKERFFSRLRAELHNLYGPTEAAVDVTYWQCQPGGDVPFVPIGRPVANTQIYVLDRFMQPVPIGVAGELHIGGVQVGRGYLNRPELTAQKFVADPFSAHPGARLYKSGDLVRFMATGAIEYLGRIDHQVKVRGFRIELGEIETILEQHAGVRTAVVTVRDDGAGERQLVGYVVPDLDHQPLLETGVPRVAEVQSIFDQTYASAKIADVAFDPAGWNSSYTGLPLPETHIREWVDGVVERIAALQPRHVLEIGCGTGMLLFRLARDCSRYVACDVSEVAIRQLEATLRLEEFRLPHVELSIRAAHDIRDLPPAAFDVVVINSVAQYFPSLAHLLDVLTVAVARVRPGGHVFLGDLRSLPLLRVFHASVEVFRAEGGVAAAELLKRVDRKVELDEELVVSPEFVTLLPRFIAGVEDVEVQLKRGRHDNEMTRFRYDAVLHVGHGCRRARPQEIEWTGAESIESVVRKCLERAPESVVVRGIPNARIAENCRMLEMMERHPTSTIEQLRAIMTHEAGRGVEPEDVWELGTELSYEVSLAWSAVDACFDARFDRSASCAAPDTASRAPSRSPDWVALRRLANDPRVGLSARRLIPELRRHLKEKLPDYMVPNALLLMSAFPLSPNGKVDRQALPAPEFVRSGVTASFVAPRTELEQGLADIWAEVLGIDGIGIRDNFFDLGGDSILNIQIAARANEAGINLTPLLIFTHQTIETLARAIGECAAEPGTARADDADSAQVAEAGAQPPVPESDELVAAFPVAGLSPGELRTVLGGGRNVEDIYPLAPLQEGMLFHGLYEVGSGLYCVQLSGDLPARLDSESFAAAWKAVVARHAALRTRFAWEGLRHPVQVVHNEVRLAFAVEDWRNVAADERAQRMRQYRENRDVGYSLDCAPPMEIRLLRLEHAHRLIWNFHHILLDGWSMIDVLGEVFATYNQIRRGQVVAPRASHQYRAYIEWVMRQDLEAAKRYWQKELSTFVEPTQFCDLVPPLGAPNVAANYRKLTFELSQVVLEPLLSDARRNRLTVNTLVHAAWSLLLCAVSGRDDVVFGSVVPGRPPSLIGAEAIVGLLINTVPVRARVPAEDTQLVFWLHELQHELTRTREHGFVSLPTLQRWSGVPAGRPLFESFIAVQGYLRGNGSLEQWAAGIGLNNIELIDWNNLPLSLAVEVGAALKVLIKYDRTRLREETAQDIAADLRWLMEAMSAGLDNAVRHLVEPLRQRRAQRLAHEDTHRQQQYRATLRSVKRRAIVPQDE